MWPGFCGPRPYATKRFYLSCWLLYFMVQKKMTLLCNFSEVWECGTSHSRKTVSWLWINPGIPELPDSSLWLLLYLPFLLTLYSSWFLFCLLFPVSFFFSLFLFLSSLFISLHSVFSFSVFMFSSLHLLFSFFWYLTDVWLNYLFYIDLSLIWKMIIEGGGRRSQQCLWSQDNQPPG